MPRFPKGPGPGPANGTPAARSQVGAVSRSLLLLQRCGGTPGKAASYQKPGRRPASKPHCRSQESANGRSFRGAPPPQFFVELAERDRQEAQHLLIRGEPVLRM